MDIKLNPDVIQGALQKNVDKAVEEAFSSYEITKRIREEVADKVVGGMLARALDAAIPQLDLERIATSLAHEIQRNTVASVVKLLEGQTVEMLLRLRGIPEFDKEAREKARTEILYELRAAKEGV